MKSQHHNALYRSFYFNVGVTILAYSHENRNIATLIIYLVSSTWYYHCITLIGVLEDFDRRPVGRLRRRQRGGRGSGGAAPERPPARAGLPGDSLGGAAAAREDHGGRVRERSGGVQGTGEGVS